MFHILGDKRSVGGEEARSQLEDRVLSQQSFRFSLTFL